MSATESGNELLTPRSAVDVLAKLPPETLERMLANVRRDLEAARQRLAFAELEGEQIAEAIAAQALRSREDCAIASADKITRRGGV